MVDSDNLIDAAGVADILGLNSHAGRNAVSVYERRYPDMARPVLNLGANRARLWSRSAILEWARGTRRIT